MSCALVAACRIPWIPENLHGYLPDVSEKRFKGSRKLRFTRHAVASFGEANQARSVWWIVLSLKPLNWLNFKWPKEHDVSDIRNPFLCWLGTAECPSSSFTMSAPLLVSRLSMIRHARHFLLHGASTAKLRQGTALLYRTEQRRFAV